MMWEFEAKKTDRLDRLLRQASLPGAEWLSRQAWDWLLEKGLVQVNGRRVVKAGAETAIGARVSVALPSESLGVLPGEKSASLVWSDSRLAIFNKPCGVDTLPIFPWDSSSFTNQVAAHFAANGPISLPQFTALAEAPKLEGGVLQRLDRDTSGLICVALDMATKSLFRKIFSESKIEKTYLAIVEGDPSAASGEHEVWLSPANGAKVKASLASPKGESEASSLSIEIYKKSARGALVKIRTAQGARHVVRAGMAALGSPLLGDELYGGNMSFSPFHQLHASSLRLLDQDVFPAFPASIEASPPESFLDSLRQLGIHYPG